MELGIIATAFFAGALTVVVAALIIQRIERYQYEQDELHDKAAAYDRAKRANRAL